MMSALPISASKPKRSFCLQALICAATLLLLSGCHEKKFSDADVDGDGVPNFFDSDVNGDGKELP